MVNRYLKIPWPVHFNKSKCLTKKKVGTFRGSRTHITDEVEIHDDCHLPEAGVVLPGGAGHILGLALGLEAGEIIPRSHRELRVKTGIHETFAPGNWNVTYTVTFFKGLFPLSIK